MDHLMGNIRVPVSRINSARRRLKKQLEYVILESSPLINDVRRDRLAQRQTIFEHRTYERKIFYEGPMRNGFYR